LKTRHAKQIRAGILEARRIWPGDDWERKLHGYKHGKFMQDSTDLMWDAFMEESMKIIERKSRAIR